MLVQQPSSPHPHERIGRYEVLRKIATGGMAELFLAKQVGMEGFEKVVAIKRILAHLAFDEEFINMFRDEARIVAKLSHPNIVQIYDLGKSDDTYFIAMEYIPGRNLSSVAKKAKAKGEKLPPEFIARCIAQACEGLYYAHTRQDIDGKPLKIVHRDVSPQNIILAFSGGVKLVDFGIAKAATKIAHTRAGVLKGKYAYMSPEQIRGDEVDARSDLFAVGIVLYELLCGRRPFEKENSIQTLKAIVQEKHVDCRELNSDIPDGLASIIDKALSKTWADRWTSAQELQLALEDFVAGTGKRCNNIVISKWVSDLFAEELSRDRGGTMVFKGVGEIILPDLDANGEEKKSNDAPAADASAELSDASNSKSVSVELESRIVDELREAVDSGAVPLQRVRGGGSVNLPARPPIQAPSTALGDLSGMRRDPSGRQALIEEGIIDHPLREKDDGDGWNDDKTALATDDPPKKPQPAQAEIAEEGEIDAEIIAKGPASYDDSKTEFADHVPEENIEEIGEDEDEALAAAAAEAAGDDSSELDATWVPKGAELKALQAKVRDHSLITGQGSHDLLAEDDAAEELPAASESDDDDPWEDKTIGYPDGTPPLGDEDEGTGDYASHDSANSHGRGMELGEVDTAVPPEMRDEARRDGALMRDVQAWGNLESVEHSKSGDVDLWDDKTATNDAYQADEDLVASPIVQSVDVADPTINALSLNSDVLRAMGPNEELSGDATMSGINLAEPDQRRMMDPEIADDEEIDRDAFSSSDGFGDAASMDRTIAGLPPVTEDEESSSDFEHEHETRRAFDEESLPVPRSNKNVDADSRTVAGVTSDFVLSGLPVPPVGAYDPKASGEIEIDIPPQSGGGIAEAKPKPKRTAQGLGAIKLAKAPLLGAPKAAGDRSDEPGRASRPAAPPKARSIEFSEERTESGESFDGMDLDSNAPDEVWEPQISDQGDRDTTEGHAAISKVSKAKKAPAAVNEHKASQLIEQAFDDFSLDEDLPPKADPPRPTPSMGMNSRSSVMSVKIPPPLNPPSSPGGPAAIGSTNVPPANLSLSEMLSIPIGNGTARSGFQVFSRSVSQVVQSPAAASGAPVPSLRGRQNSIASRQIRETVRTSDFPAQPEPGLRLPMPSGEAPREQPPMPAVQLDFMAIQQEAARPPKSRARLWLIMGVVLALALALVAAVIIVPALMSREPQLTIRTMPDGAEIYLNGQLQPAKTPATLGGLQPGVTYELKLTRDGFEPVSKAVPIPRNTRNILVQIPLREAKPQ